MKTYYFFQQIFASINMLASPLLDENKATNNGLL